MTAARLLGDGLFSMAMLTFLELSTWRYSIQLQIWFIRATCRVSLDKKKGSRAVSPPKQLSICFDLLGNGASKKRTKHIPQMVVGWWFTMVESVKKHFKQIQDLVGFHLVSFSVWERDDIFGTIPAFVSPKYFTKTQKEQPSINHSISHFQHKKCHQLRKETVSLELSPATKAFFRRRERAKLRFRFLTLYRGRINPPTYQLTGG